MHKQLLLFQNAIGAYFAGNKQALENCVKEFHIKVKDIEGKQQSFLEHWTKWEREKDMMVLLRIYEDRILWKQVVQFK